MGKAGEKLRLMAVGDILIHLEIESACRGEDGYDFSGLFENVRGVFKEADLVIGNQETILSDRVPPSGFPVFATPTAVGDAEAEVFDLITTATNHSLDQGEQGMEDNYAFWEENAIPAAGIYPRSSERCYARVERNGIKVAVYNATAVTNYHVQLPGSRLVLETISSFTEDHMKQQISNAHRECDYVIVMPHWGIEYLYEPTERVRKLARFFAEAGADMIIGTHPHVVEPVETIKCSDGRRVPCFYSLGNFISAQKRPATMLGGLADVTLERGTKGKVRATELRLRPLAAHTGPDMKGFTVYPLEEYSDELASENALFKLIEAEYGVRTDTAYLKDLFGKILSGEAQKENMFRHAADVKLYNATRLVPVLKKEIKKKLRQR